MTIDEVKKELETYIGTPKCMDCKWKLGTDITDYCSCNSKSRDDEKHTAAFNRARELQAFISANSQDQAQR
jgi:hypothetical protein